MDYFSILKLKKEPFSNSPDPEYFFQSQQHLGCLQKLELSLRLRRGLNVVIGDVGTGKTTLCRQLIRKFADDDNVHTHLILDPYFNTPNEFLRSVAGMLGIVHPQPSADDYFLKEQIKKLLFQKGVDEEKTIVLIIDEGQKIPEFCLELLREFLNYETNEFKLLQIAIFAQREFEKILGEHENFADRINLYHLLQPMNFRDTRMMIQYRLNQSSAANRGLALFTYPALWAIYRATRGYPRKIVNLCHRSILSMIIQNKTRANWFLVQSCIKRALVGSRRLTWKFGSLALVLSLAAALLVLRFPAGSIKMPIAGEPDSHKIAPEQSTKSVKGKTTPSKPDVQSGFSQAAAKLIPEKTPALPIGQLSDESATPIDDEGYQVSSTKAAAELLPAPVIRPKILGQLKVKRSETLGGMIQKIYGLFTSKYLDAVVAMNPHISNPNSINVGDAIAFPAITHTIAPTADRYWWVEVNRRDNIEEAFNLLRHYPRSAPRVRLIPFWNATDGLMFSVVLNRYFYDEPSAVKKMNELPPEVASDSRVISAWKDESLFYANPYTGLDH